MKLSVIIPVREDARIRGCLEALCRRQTSPKDEFEVVVVDDGPSEVVERIVSEFPARYVAERGVGSYAARNHGIEEARGDLLAFTDADCVPSPRWIEEILLTFEDASCRIAVGPSYAANSTAVALWTQSVDDTRWTALLAAESATAFCDTRNLAARREVFASERFDPAFRWAGDVELGFRLSARGQRIRLAPNMQVGHVNPTRLRDVLRRGIRRGKGLEQLYRKHGAQVRLGGERSVSVLGRDIKGPLLALVCAPGFRTLSILGLLPILGGLLAVLAALARTREGGRTGARLFGWFERLSLLLGRLLA